MGRQLNYSVDTQILSDGAEIQNEIQQDYARVDVYYQTLSVKLTKERAAYTVSVMEETTKLCFFHDLPYSNPNFYTLHFSLKI